MLTGMEHSKQVHKHNESIDTAVLELSTKFDLITCCQGNHGNCLGSVIEDVYPTQWAGLRDARSHQGIPPGR